MYHISRQANTFSLNWGVKLYNPKTTFRPLSCSDAFFLFLSLFFLVVTLHILYFSSFPTISSLSRSGLQLFRLVSSSCCSSVAFLALSSGGWRQHRISSSLKRAVSPQKACKEEFNNSRCVCVCVYCMCYVLFYFLQNTILFLLPK